VLVVQLAEITVTQVHRPKMVKESEITLHASMEAMVVSLTMVMAVAQVAVAVALWQVTAEQCLLLVVSI
jgi:hypothetical protein